VGASSAWRATLTRSCLAAVLLLPHIALGQTAVPAPEAPTGRTAKVVGAAAKEMVAAANPLAARAGLDVLAAGGSAADAAVAVQLVLNLVEPQSSGIGGGAFLLFWDQESRTLTALDGREKASAAARPERFLGPDGKPMAFYDAVVGGLSVGVPGTVRLLDEAHRRWGKLPWKDVFGPAIRLADEGFAISPRLSGLLGRETHLPKDPVARAAFYEPDGSPKPVGAVLKNPALAATFRALAQGGADAFYGGEIAQDVVASVTGHPVNPGDMTLDDLRAYAVEERAPVCGPYRGYTICGMGPPSSGAIAVQQILGLLETKPMEAMGPGPEAAHWLSEAGRLAYADRALYVADPAFVNVPTKGLIDPDYLKSRASLMQPDRSMGKARPGEPPFQKTFRYAPSDGVEFGTSHISIVDRNGNAASMTTTIEDGFGARIMTRSGFLLNNELTDFAFVPADDGKPVANRVEPGKRPRSSMAPTIVFGPSGQLHAVVGSPGGSLIINYVAKTLVGLLDWKLDPQVAVDIPNFGSRNGPTELEAGTEAESWRGDLQARGHEVRAIDQNSGIQAIVVTPDGLLGGADSRREGVAIGH
jgi:gamma-glutamyltranspeptidase / glutathione hydrolase